MGDLNCNVKVRARQANVGVEEEPSVAQVLESR